jgi:ankyrin repeat protein
MTGINDNTPGPNASGEPPANLPSPAAINFPIDSHGNTYLHDLCRGRQTTPADIRRALELGADINALNKQKLPPLALAIQYGNPDTVACLIEAGARTFMKLDNGLFFNAYTIAGSYPDITRALLKLDGGLYINHPGVDSSGLPETMTILQLAVRRDHPKLIPLLAAAGALPSILTGVQPMTALMIAGVHNKHESILPLLEAGADIDQKNPDGNTALHFAAKAGSFHATEKLIAAGADINVTNNKGETPAHLAATSKTGNRTLRLLIEHPGINVDAKTDEGKTALILSAKINHVEAVKMLLEAKADPMLSDIFNRRALSYSKDNEGTFYERANVQEMLQEAEDAAHSRHFEKNYKKRRP